jgi:NAD(P)H-dependent FMN reductase
LSESIQVLVLVGSLRAASFTRKVANALVERAPQSMQCRFAEIGDLPQYNEDLESQVPESWARLRGEVHSADAALFVTPEYNRSVPGLLKNALDVASRPGGKNAWNALPSAVVSVTPYKLGAFGANHHLRQSFVFLNMPAMQQPEAYISNVADLFDESGKLKVEETSKFLTTFMLAFEKWIGRTRRD